MASSAASTRFGRSCSCRSPWPSCPLAPEPNEDLSRLGARDRVQRACRELLDHEAMESLDLGRSERGAAVGRDAPAASPPHVAGAVVRAERERVALARQRDGKLGARRRRDDVLADEALDEARLRLRLLITCERRVEAVGGRG